MSTEKQHKPSQAEKLLGLAKQAKLFKTPEGEACATLPIGTFAIKDQKMRDWLLLQYSRENRGMLPSKATLDNVLASLGAEARLEGATQELFTRLGWLDDCVYLDLGPMEGRTQEYIKISTAKWEFCSEVPVKFQRPNGFLPLPDPVTGGTLDALRGFLNISDQDEWILLSSWLVGTLMPRGPYAFMALHGEKGSGKSTITRFIRNLIDPFKPITTGLPDDMQTLRLRARNTWILAFNNISYISPKMSDALCRLSEGAGDSKKTNYTDTDETLFDAVRTCVFNGIPDFATASDLLDRTITITEPHISKRDRKAIKLMNEQYELARPRLIGALLNYAREALANLSSTELAEKPRMADFALWVVASGLWTAEEFLPAYEQNQDDNEAGVLENSVEAMAIVDFMVGKDEYKDTAANLLKALTNELPKKLLHRTANTTTQVASQPKST